MGKMSINCDTPKILDAEKNDTRYNQVDILFGPVEKPFFFLILFVFYWFALKDFEIVDKI